MIYHAESNPNPKPSLYWNVRLVKFEGVEQPKILPVVYHAELKQPLLVHDSLMSEKVSPYMVVEAFENMILEVK